MRKYGNKFAVLYSRKLEMLRAKNLKHLEQKMRYRHVDGSDSILKRYSAKSGYSKPRFSGVKEFQICNLDEAKALCKNSYISVMSVADCFDKMHRIWDVHVTSVKTWKTRPKDLRIRYKFGIYNYGEIWYKDGEPFSSQLFVVIEYGNIVL